MSVSLRHDSTTSHDLYSFVFQHVQRVLPNISAVPVCDGKRRLTLDQTALSTCLWCLIDATIYCHMYLFVCVGKLPECPPGSCYAGDSPPLPELDSFRLHLRDQAHQHSGVQGKPAKIHSVDQNCRWNICIVGWNRITLFLLSMTARILIRVNV